MNLPVKSTSNALAIPSTKQEFGGALVKTGLGAGGLYLAAGILPFVTFPMLLVLAVLAGGYLYVK